jgi:hypothetical protein
MFPIDDAFLYMIPSSKYMSICRFGEWCVAAHVISYVQVAGCGWPHVVWCRAGAGAVFPLRQKNLVPSAAKEC